MEHLKPVDEKRANPWLYTVPSDYSNEMTGFGLPMNDMLFNVQSQVIRQLADRESLHHCGKMRRFCSGVLPQCDFRIYPCKYAGTNQTDYGTAEHLFTGSGKPYQKRDKDRSLYYNFFTDKNGGAQRATILFLNSTTLGVDRCVQIICSLVK